ncbi:hypothetical protein C1H46_023139 [Malus baccata]|uniref:Uncharacterized protein n=1 Tax=Malus baccata TaxID=106549 RepID=A0A540LXZ1_MALBA|nr:hypothetical protein C1H46_023139 [Malus baccata]
MLYSIRHGDVPWLYDSCKPLVLTKNDMGSLCWVDLAKKVSRKLKLVAFIVALKQPFAWGAFAFLMETL